MILMDALEKIRISLRFTVVSVFIFSTLVTAIIAIGLQYHFSRAMALETALTQYQKTAANTKDYLLSVDQTAQQTTAIVSKFPNLIQNHWINPDAKLLFSEIMERNRLFYAIYIGFENGDFYELVNLNSSPSVRRQLRASPDDRWVIITVQGQGEQRVRQFDYFNDVFEFRISRQESSQYLANQRLWFMAAKPNEVHKTAPYLFQHLQAPGQTFSTVIPGTHAVLAVDITLSSLSSYLRGQSTDRKSEIYLHQKSGELVASNQYHNLDSTLPDAEPLPLNDEQRSYLKQLHRMRISNELDWPPIDYAISGNPQGYSIDFIRLIANITDIKIEFVNGYKWYQLVNMFKNDELDILQPIFRNNSNDSNGLMSDPILKLPYAIVTQLQTKPITHLHQLSGKILAIPEGWSIIQIIEEHYPKITVLEVESTLQALHAVLQGDADATLDSSLILHYTANQFFIEGLQFHEQITFSQADFPDQLHLLISKKHRALLPIINAAIAEINNNHRNSLKSKWFDSQEQQTDINKTLVVPYPQLIQLAENHENHNRLQPATINGQPHFLFTTPLNKNIKGQEFFSILIPARTLLKDSSNTIQTSIFITGGLLLILLPFAWLFASPIVKPIKRLAQESGKIQRREYDQVKHCDSNISEINDLSSSIVDMSKAIQQYELELKQLMESMIQAIDEKSPYTAGHCARVPELALMIAEAANQSTQPPFDRFQFNTDDELREFKIASWLHDCGKITTPEHIIDKSTKLETIYNRIHEIRLRFEILHRDAEIIYFKKCANNPQKKYELEKALQQKQTSLQADFAFLAQLNIGSESVSDDDIERLQQLALKTWQRHFDDRLGLSHIELGRYAITSSTLPATETLLADKPEHLIKRHHSPDYDPKLGIRMDIPEHLYNLGEIYNLSVSRGTLTKEDRFKINEHMISTIKMLDSLQFPKDLANVPRYASTHHETLKGTGYPRKLNAEQLSLPERIIAVADIFEALTAADRPYKPAKSVNTAINILYKLVQAGAIDRTVFELFLTSGVYLEYAERFLSESQIDAVNIQMYLR